MSPNFESTSSMSSSSSKFIPSLACIAEEEPKIVAIRRIFTPENPNAISNQNSNSKSKILKEVPIFDVNIYAPEPPKAPISGSYQRLLAEMDKYIGTQKDNRKYKEMAKSLRHQVDVEQAETRRLSNPNFSDRDWYWYAEQTKSYVDLSTDNEKNAKIVMEEEKNVENPEKPENSEPSTPEDDGFDLSADF